MRGAFCCAAGGGAESFQGMRDDKGRGRMGPAYAPHGRRVSFCGPAGGNLREQGTVPKPAQAAGHSRLSRLTYRFRFGRLTEAPQDIYE